MIRKATPQDIDAIAAIYDRIHTAEERGETTTGWQRAIYPKRETALAALGRGDLFIMESAGRAVGTGIINQSQVDVYAQGGWRHPAPDNEVMVLHTLVIDPLEKGKGYGTQFVKDYEAYALEHGCPYLRIDTNERNTAARSLYRRLGFEEIGIIPCMFNGLPDIRLVLLEKYLIAAPAPQN